jgi:hypothetical protein
MTDPPRPHPKHLQCDWSTWKLGVRSSWSGSGQLNQPLAGTTSPVRASTYSRGSMFFNGSSLDNETARGLADVAAVDRCRGWWRFGGCR